MKILTKEELNAKLCDYYKTHYGEKETDVFYDKPAVNVCVFKRDNKYISLKAHILTGEVEEFIEEERTKTTEQTPKTTEQTKNNISLF